MNERTVYPVDVNGVKRDLRLFEVAPGLRIAILNILGDTELTIAAAKGLVEKLADVDYDLFITAEAKSIPLSHAISAESGKPYIVLRKGYKPYMGNVIEAETVSITTGKKQTLLLDEKDHALVKGAKAVLIDDVISTGSTLTGMESIVEQAGGSVAAIAAIFTEGDANEWAHVVSLGHLPLFTEE